MPNTEAQLKAGWNPADGDCPYEHADEPIGSTVPPPADAPEGFK